VLDTRDLPRHPGSSRRVRSEVPAPPGIGSGLFAVPVGSTLTLDVLLESVVEGVLVTAVVTGTVAGECGYCLEPDARALTVDVRELFTYPGQRDEPGMPYPGPDRDDDVRALVGDLADLEPAVRDAVVLALPFSRLCDDSCRRLEPAREPLADADEVVDSRWEALRPAVEPGD
jgi:uncharacterized protein